LEGVGMPPVSVEVHDNQDGTYDCSYPGVKKAGTYTLTPTVGGEKVKGAPFTIKVAPGGFSLDNTTVDFPAEWIAGLPGPTVSARDSAGNLRPAGADVVKARLIPLDETEVKGKRKPDGAFTVAFPPDSRGDYTVRMKVNNNFVPGGPWPVHVDGKPLSQEHESALALLAPATQDVFRRILGDCSEAERNKVLRELAKLAGSKFSSGSSSSSD